MGAKSNPDKDGGKINPDKVCLLGAKSTRTRYAYAYWADSGRQGAKSCLETPVLSGAFYPVPLLAQFRLKLSGFVFCGLEFLRNVTTATSKGNQEAILCKKI